MNYHNMSTGSVSTGTSSIFSSDGDNYDYRIREIEEYYVKTLLNDDDDNGDDEEDPVGSEASSVNSSPKQQHYQPLDCFKPSVQDTGVLPSRNSNPLEVDINANIMPSLDALPLTTENLQRLTISGTPRKSSPQIQVTTRAPEDSRQQLNKELYKTELCESFTTKGHCKYGNKCQFAHGLQELKIKPRATNFRTKPCINWSKLGYCPYGKRCCFKHGDDQDIKVYTQARKPKNLHANVKALQKITW